MTTVCTEFQQIKVPTWVVDLESFRAWTGRDDFPNDARIWFLDGGVWIDMAKEQIFTHSLLKNEISHVLTGQVKQSDSGWYLPDGVYLSNSFADFSGKPDAMYVSRQRVKKGRVELIAGVDGGFVEVVGAPDMVLEVVSTSSVIKDSVVLKNDYWEAGVKEYWLIDGRKDPASFNIFKHGANGFVATRQVKGWLKSTVFGMSFQLKQSKDQDGYPRFELLVK